jgi:hypothetical protein
MTIISSAAHLRLCHCGKHGEIVTAAGLTSSEICSKKSAREALQQFARNKDIMECEMGEALRQINASSLKETDADASLAARITAEIFNSIFENPRPSCDATMEQSKWVN